MTPLTAESMRLRWLVSAGLDEIGDVRDHRCSRGVGALPSQYAVRPGASDMRDRRDRRTA
jgi:hypothetical protein